MLIRAARARDQGLCPAAREVPTLAILLLCARYRWALKALLVRTKGGGSGRLWLYDED